MGLQLSNLSYVSRLVFKMVDLSTIIYLYEYYKFRNFFFNQFNHITSLYIIKLKDEDEYQLNSLNTKDVRRAAFDRKAWFQVLKRQYTISI